MDANTESAATLIKWSELVEDDYESARVRTVSRRRSLVQRYCRSFKVSQFRLRSYLNSIFLVVLLFLLLYSLRIAPFSHRLGIVRTGIENHGGGADPKSQNVCYTKRCNETGHNALVSMNRSAEPCHDFEEFACGGWRKTCGLNNCSLSEWRFNEVSQILLDILEAPVKETDGAPLRLAKGFYKQCTDLMALEKVGKGPILKLLDDHGGWPSLRGPLWKPENFSLVKSFAFVDVFLRFAPFITFCIVPYYGGNYSMILYIEGPYLLLDKGKYRQSSEAREEQISEFKSKYVNMSMQLSGKNLDTYEEDAVNITHLEERLINATQSMNETAKLYGNLDELVQDMYGSPRKESSSQFNLESILGELLSTSKVAADVVKNKTELPVKVQDIHYLKQLVEIIDSTPPRVLANYLHFIVVSKLSEETLKYSDFAHLNESAQATARKERTTLCQHKATKAFKMAMAAEYMRQNPHETLYHKEVQLIALNIKNVFNETFAAASWLSDAFREFVVNKLEAMAIHVGYPQWILNETLLMDEYSGLSLGPTYLDTFLNVNVWQRDRLIRESSTPDAWSNTPGIYPEEAEEKKSSTRLSDEEALPDEEYGPFVVNAWNNYVENAVVMPLGMIGSPYYDKDDPMLIKYAKMGFMIAHEIAHGFAEGGITWTTNRTVTHDHITDGDETELKQKQRCLAQQYAEFRSQLWTDTLRKFNGMENTADNVAVIMAYRAYRKWIESENGSKPEPTLPHLEQWTPDQLFFLSFAMSWCEAEELAAMAFDPHSPGKLRVNVPLQNSPEFAEAWRCKLGTRMNPKRKCMDL